MVVAFVRAQKRLLCYCHCHSQPRLSDTLAILTLAKASCESTGQRIEASGMLEAYVGSDELEMLSFQDRRITVEYEGQSISHERT
jgi:hypothetical protein